MSIGEYRDATFFLDMVREVAGDAGVRRVEDARGGTSVHIPLKLKRGHWLSGAPGYSDARKVVDRLRVYNADNRQVRMPGFVVPLGLRARAWQLRDQTERMIFDGVSVSEIALSLRIHERTVWRHKARLVQAGKLPANSSSETKAIGA